MVSQADGVCYFVAAVDLLLKLPSLFKYLTPDAKSYIIQLRKNKAKRNASTYKIQKYIKKRNLDSSDLYYTSGTLCLEIPKTILLTYKRLIYDKGRSFTLNEYGEEKLVGGYPGLVLKSFINELDIKKRSIKWDGEHFSFDTDLTDKGEYVPTLITYTFKHEDAQDGYITKEFNRNNFTTEKLNRFMKRDRIVGGFLIIDTVKDEDIGSHVMPFYVQVKKKKTVVQKSIILCNWGKCASLDDTIDRIFDERKSIRGIMLREIKCLYIPNADDFLASNEFEMGDDFDKNIYKMFLKFDADADTATRLAKVIEHEVAADKLFIIDEYIYLSMLSRIDYNFRKVLFNFNTEKNRLMNMIRMWADPASSEFLTKNFLLFVDHIPVTETWLLQNSKSLPDAIKNSKEWLAYYNNIRQAYSYMHKKLDIELRL